MVINIQYDSEIKSSSLRSSKLDCQKYQLPVYTQVVMAQHFEQGTYPATLHHVLFGHNGLQSQNVLQVVEEQEMNCLLVSMKEFFLLYVMVQKQNDQLDKY